jgi:hypothetical protein
MYDHPGAGLVFSTFQHPTVRSTVPCLNSLILILQIPLTLPSFSDSPEYVCNRLKLHNLDQTAVETFGKRGNHVKKEERYVMRRR